MLRAGIIVLVLTMSIWWLRGRAEDQRKIDQFNIVLREVQEARGSAETAVNITKTRQADFKWRWKKGFGSSERALFQR